MTIQRAECGIEGSLEKYKSLVLHFEDYAQTILNVVRIDHPDYDKPLLIRTGARELTTGQLWTSYRHRIPVETNFFVAQDTAAMEMPRAWTETAIKRSISLAL